MSKNQPIHPPQLYRILHDHFGHQDWWPYDKIYHEKNGSDFRFEIMIGAILTQNTAWTNVEKALYHLKTNHSLTIEKIVDIPENHLKTMIQPSGYYNQKATRLKSLSTYLYDQYQADLDIFFQRDLYTIRDELLSLNGIGPETADSILLYAGEHPIFVVDAYTKRLCTRIPLSIPSSSYDDIQTYFHTYFSPQTSIETLIITYKDLHALIVECAKNYCKTKPSCKSCPLQNQCTYCLL